MKNKIMIGIGMLLLILGIGSALQNNMKSGFELFVVTSMEKVFLDGRTVGNTKFTLNAECALARNEYESFQILVKNQNQALKGLRVELSDLVNPETGVKIDKQNLTYRFVGYVKTKKPYYATKLVGMWPDPLLSVDSFDVGSGITQPIWVTLYTPADTPAGIYVGKIRVFADGGLSKEVDIKVKVWNFVLPSESHLKTAFDLYAHLLKEWYPAKANEIEKEWRERLNRIRDSFYIDMLKHRISPILNIEPTASDFDNRMNVYREYGLSNFAIGKRNGSNGNNWPKTTKELQELIPLYRQYAQILREHQLLKMSYIYTWDEGKVGNPMVKSITQMIHQADLELRNMVCYHGFWNPDKDSEWGKDIDIWCFQIEDYNEGLKKKLEGIGKEIWMYVSGPGGSYPNLAIDFSAIDPRIIPWMCWKYNIKGLLYWCVNWWTVNPYQSVANTNWGQNGNGLLYYPGENGPVSSLRLELIRDGIEDYEYFFLLGQRIKQLETKESNPAIKAALDKAKALLSIDSSIINSLKDYTQDPELIYKRRRDIAETIEALDKLM